jgi:hypothetical protein
MGRDVALPVDVLSPIFIGGQRRSGTTVLRMMLDRHRRIACGPESHFASRFMRWHDQLAQEWSETVRRYGFGPEVVDGAFAALANSIFSRHQRLQGKERWAEKTPRNILRIEYLFRLFPGAQFVHVIRDPRDAYCSIREKVRTDKPQWAKFTPQYAAGDWCAAVLMGRQWRSHPDQYIEVRYEELVGTPEAAMRRILRFLHEPWDSHVLAPVESRSQSGRRPGDGGSHLYKTSVGRWRRELSAAEVEAIQEIAGELLTDLGYELMPTPGQSNQSGSL